MYLRLVRWHWCIRFLFLKKHCASEFAAEKFQPHALAPRDVELGVGSSEVVISFANQIITSFLRQGRCRNSIGKMTQKCIFPASLLKAKLMWSLVS